LDAVLEHNRSIFSELAISNSLLINNNLAPTPLNFWNIHLSNHMHALKKVNAEQIMAQLLTPVKVSMTRGGLKYKDLYYSCDHIVKNKLASVARSHGQWSLDARVFEDSTDYIYVKFQENSLLKKCYLLQKSKIMAGLSFTEVDCFHDWLDDKKEKSPVGLESFGIKKRKEVMEIKAKKRQNDITATYAQRSRNVKSNRESEIVMLEADKDNKFKENHEIINNINSNVVSILPRSKRKKGK
jgi:hypothetical protein